MTTEGEHREQELAVDRILRFPREAQFDRIRETNPVGNRDAWMLLADAEMYAFRQQAKAARVAAGEALRRDPASPLTWSLWGSMQPSPHWDPLLQSAISAFPSLAYPRIHHAQHLLARGDDQGAIEELREVVREHPNVLAGWRAKYRASFQGNSARGMLEATTRIVELDPDGYRPRRAHAVALFRCGSRREAFRVARDAADRSPGWRARLFPYFLPLLGLSPTGQSVFLIIPVIGITALLVAVYQGHAPPWWAWFVFALALVYRFGAMKVAEVQTRFRPERTRECLSWTGRPTRHGHRTRARWNHLPGECGSDPRRPHGACVTWESWDSASSF